MATQKQQQRSTPREHDSDSEMMSASDSEGSAGSSDAAGGLFDKDSDEEELERLVLGSKASFGQNLFKNGDFLDGSDDDGAGMGEGDADAGELEDIDDADLFMIDTGAAGTGLSVAKSSTSQSKKNDQGDLPAWEDSDDDRLAVSLAGATRLRKLRITEAEDVVSGTEYCRGRRQEARAAARGARHPADARAAGPAPDARRVPVLPPRVPRAAVGEHGVGAARQVDVRSAQFLRPRGDKIFFAGRRRYFHHWDLPSGVVRKTTQVLGHQLEHRSMERFRLSPCGRYMGIVASTRKGGGVINVLNTTSMQWIAAARLQSHNGVADFAWWSTGDGLTILGKDGMVGEYSMESKSFVGIWHDDGCVGGIVLALGGHGGPQALGEDRWVAVGSNSGITNIYERQELLVPDQSGVAVKERPTPKRMLDQLVTPITVLAFSPDGQLLAFGSREKKDALRLVHLPSCTVYRNWPTDQTPLGRITTVAFGNGSDILAVGNDAGKIRLWNIRS
ncbi:hypothetical protein HIM_02445 [Hirsutella minnesotensis 3608]|nr:hypothetical protein HIM_02445 [Hirsutella minnesotensis 3608]